MGANLTLLGSYTLNYANSNTSGAGYIPSIPCATSTLPACGIPEDYGRASFDVRHRAFVGGTVSLPWGFRVSPFLIAQSGPPFNITTGQDLYGINSFNARPTVGTCGSSGVISTVYGCFNEVAQPGQIGIPINQETGPGRFALNLRLSKTFGFGEKKETAARGGRSEEHTSELQSRLHLVCRLLLEKKKNATRSMLRRALLGIFLHTEISDAEIP